MLAYVVVCLCNSSLLMAGLLATFRTQMDREKASAFECGFDPIGIARAPFCIKFFLIRIIFLVFDVEVSLLLPAIYSTAQVLRLVVLLAVGTLYEWAAGGLDWIV